MSILTLKQSKGKKLMYRRKNKKPYTIKNNDQHIDHSIYELFSIIRHNKSLNIFKEKLEQVMSSNSLNIENILYQGNDLLVTAAMFESEDIFQYLVENFKSNLENSLEKCIFLTYSNKSPTILKLALKTLGLPTENFKNHIIQSVIERCYRTENIQIFKTWLEKHLNEIETLEVSRKLIINNNKPFLSEICYDNYWKKQIVKIIPEFTNLINSRTENYFFHTIISSEHQLKNKDEIEIKNYNISLITNNITPDLNKELAKKILKTSKNSNVQPLSKEKIGLKENHKPIVITKKRVSLS